MAALPPTSDARIESLLGEVERDGDDPEARARIQALVAAVLEWHRGAGSRASSRSRARTARGAKG